MACFYEDVFGLARDPVVHPDVGRLSDPAGAGVALHALPAHVRDTIEIASPPRWRRDTATKLTFETDDLDATRSALVAHGGQAEDPWDWNSARYCECVDPEGNLVQLFEPAKGPTPPG